MRQPLDAHQAEDLALVLRQAVDRLQHPAPVRREAGFAAGRGGHKPFAQFHGGGSFIQAAGQVIELPAHVLVGQGEELAHGLGTDRTHGLEQPFHHAAKHFRRLQIHRRPGQSRVAPVQHGGAQPLQAVSGPFQQLADDRLGGHIPGEGVQVALHDGGGGFFTHDECPRRRWHPRRFYRVPCPPATLSKRGRGGARLVVTRQGRSKRMESRMTRTSGFDTASAFRGSPCVSRGIDRTVIGMTDRHPLVLGLCQVNRRVDASSCRPPVAAS